MKYLLILFLFLFSPDIDQAESFTEIPKEELLGQFNPADHPDFVQIHSEYTKKPDIYLRKEAYSAFKDMFFDAKSCGINLQIISATRNFNYQKGIWERKWNRSKYMGWQKVDKALDILQYSSMPGTSRHHWGTDIDLNQLNNDYFKSGEGAKIYNWLSQYGPEYGFYQVYTAMKDGRTGYQEEKWHWSFIPLSTGFLIQYNELVQHADIANFKGAETAKEINAIGNYVNGIQQNED